MASQKGAKPLIVLNISFSSVCNIRYFFPERERDVTSRGWENMNLVGKIGR
jgi:hypothetical protein